MDLALWQQTWFTFTIWVLYIISIFIFHIHRFCITQKKKKYIQIFEKPKNHIYGFDIRDDITTYL